MQIHYPIFHMGIVATLLCALALPQAVFAYEAAPVSLTKQPTFVTEKSARLNGQANPNQMPDTYSWFEWGISGRYDAVYETPHKLVSVRYGGNTLIDTSAEIVGLAPGTQYFYRHIVESGRGKDVGQTTYLTTKPRTNTIPTLVIVETNPPSQISDVSAQLRGYVSPHGNTNTETWFEWGVSQELEAQTTHMKTGAVAKVFEANITRLTPGTLYFYRLVAENSLGRVYGATRVFTTSGTPPPPPEKEAIQNAGSIPVSGDGVARTTTTSGTALASNTRETPSGRRNTTGLPGISSEYRPGGIFAFFRKKNAGNTVTQAATSETQTSEAQVAGVGASSGVLGSLWDNLSGKRAISVGVEKIGPKKVVAHTPVEYRISYSYNDPASVVAQLSVTLPSTVVYIGDNTANELLLEAGENGDRTYILPLGRITKGDTRTFSILGMTTGDATGFPDVSASLSYENSTGVHIVDASEGNAGTQEASAKEQTTSVGNSSDGWLPDSLSEWLLYLGIVIGLVIGVRKIREYYVMRKESLLREDEQSEDNVLSRMIPAETPPTMA